MTDKPLMDLEDKLTFERVEVPKDVLDEAFPNGHNISRLELTMPKGHTLTREEMIKVAIDMDKMAQDGESNPPETGIEKKPLL